MVSFGYTDIQPADLGGDALIDRFEDLPTAAETILAGLRNTRPQALPAA